MKKPINIDEKRLHVPPTDYRGPTVDMNLVDEEPNERHGNAPFVRHGHHRL